MQNESEDLDPLHRELARLTARLAECEAAAVDAARDRETFLTGATHALRTPLTVVKGYVQLLDLLRQQGSLGPVEPVLPLLLSQIERLEQVVNDFLTASRLHHGDPHPEPEAIDLRELLKVAITAARHTRFATPEHEIAIEAPRPVYGWFDRSEMEYALRHLALNAVQYSPGGGQVRVQAQEEDGTAVVSVADQGIGIPPEEQEQVFQPFARASNGIPVSGAGLGLYIVSRVAEHHGGTVSVRSAPGVGSTFQMRLPLSSPTGARPAA
jgi:signal transduction histidine kinase